MLIAPKEKKYCIIYYTFRHSFLLPTAETGALRVAGREIASKQVSKYNLQTRTMVSRSNVFLRWHALIKHKKRLYQRSAAARSVYV